MGTSGTHTHTHNYRDKWSQRQCADTVVVQTWWNGPAKLNKCNHCDQSGCDILQCGLLLSFLSPSINLSLLSLLFLLPFSLCFFLLHLQSLYCFYLAPRFPLMFFLALVFAFLFCLWSQHKSSAGTLQLVTLLLWPGFVAQQRWPLTSQALTSVFISFLSFSLILPHSLAAFHLRASVPARVNQRL